MDKDIALVLNARAPALFPQGPGSSKMWLQISAILREI